MANGSIPSTPQPSVPEYTFSADAHKKLGKLHDLSRQYIRLTQTDKGTSIEIEHVAKGVFKKLDPNVDYVSVKTSSLEFLRSILKVENPSDDIKKLRNLALVEWGHKYPEIKNSNAYKEACVTLFKDKAFLNAFIAFCNEGKKENERLKKGDEVKLYAALEQYMDPRSGKVEDVSRFARALAAHFGKQGSFQVIAAIEERLKLAQKIPGEDVWSNALTPPKHTLGRWV